MERPPQFSFTTRPCSGISAAPPHRVNFLHIVSSRAYPQAHLRRGISALSSAVLKILLWSHQPNHLSKTALLVLKTSCAIGLPIQPLRVLKHSARIQRRSILLAIQEAVGPRLRSLTLFVLEDGSFQVYGTAKSTRLPFFQTPCTGHV
jgi:hypothetical protein